MPFNASGVYSLPAGPRPTAGQTALAIQVTTPNDDIAAALSATFLRDGRAPMTGDLTLYRNAIDPLHAVPKQQLEASLAGKQDTLGFTPANKAYATVTLQEFGGDDNGTATDNIAALNLLRAAYPSGARIYLPRINGGDYNFASDPNLSGLVLVPQDPDIIIRAPNYLPHGARFEAPFKAQYPAGTNGYIHYFAPDAEQTAAEFVSTLSPSDQFEDTGTALTAWSALSHVSRVWPGDAFAVADTPTANDTTVTWSITADGKFHYSRLAAVAGQELAVYFPSAGSYLRAAVIECTDGWHILTEDGTGALTLFSKQVGQTATTVSKTFQGASTHATYRVKDVAEFGIRVLSQKKAQFLINKVDAIGALATFGNIEYIGFGVFSASGSVTAAVSGWMLRDKHVQNATQSSFLGVIGDSRYFSHASDIPTEVRRQLEFYRGIRITGIDNRAVPGHTSAQQLTALQAAGVGSTVNWIVGVGINDIQAGVTVGDVGVIGSSVDNIHKIITTIRSSGGDAVFVMPALHYGQQQVQDVGGGTGIGQNAINYDKGAPYYAGWERMCRTYGIKVVDLRQVAGLTIASFMLGNLKAVDPALKDNIHFTSALNRAGGRAISRAVASMMQAPITLEMPREAVPTGLFANSWTSQASPNNVTAARDRSGVIDIAGVANAGTLTAGTVVITLPTFLRPKAMREHVARTSNGVARLQINTNGQVVIPETLVGVTWISLAMTYSSL